MNRRLFLAGLGAFGIALNDIFDARGEPDLREQGRPCEGNQECAPVEGKTVVCRPIPGAGAADRCTTEEGPDPEPVDPPVTCLGFGELCTNSVECCPDFVCLEIQLENQPAAFRCLAPAIPSEDEDEVAVPPAGRKNKKKRSGNAKSKRRQGKQKREHCKNDSECAPGWHCAGGRKDSGKHRSCVKD